MKTLIMSMFAGLFVMLAVSTASAGMMGSSYHDLSSIDTSGVAVVSIFHPSSPLSLASSDRIYLDSNMVWSVSNIHSISYSESVASSSMSRSNLVCFDMTHRFCANPF